MTLIQAPATAIVQSLLLLGVVKSWPDLHCSYEDHGLNQLADRSSMPLNSSTKQLECTGVWCGMVNHGTWIESITKNKMSLIKWT